MASPCRTLSFAEVIALGTRMGLDWREIDARELARGMAIEAEHGLCHAATNVTSDDPEATAKIAVAHLRAFPRYYSDLCRAVAMGVVRRR